MIDIANKYSDELKLKFLNTWGDEKYKYWQVNGYNKGCPEFKDSDYSESHFVIKNGDDIIGYVSYCIDRQLRSAYRLEAVNFSDNKVLFGISLIRIIKDIFEKSKLNKLNFNVAIGNPIEKSYDKLLSRYGGRVVGYFKDEVILLDGTFCDYKIYEIMKSDYDKNK